MMENWEEGEIAFRRRFVFGFVRHPLTWLESCWADALEHGKLPGYEEPYARNLWFARCHADDFATFIDNVVESEPDIPSRAMLGRLGFHKEDGYLWLPDEHTPDFIGRNEDLTNDFTRALRLAGEEFDEKLVRAVAPKRVSSRLAKYKQRLIWRHDQREALYRANKQLFDGFGYTI